MRQLAKETYGRYRPDYAQWEVLGDTDIDTDLSTDEDQPSDMTADSDGSSDTTSSSGYDSDSSGSGSNDGLNPWEVTDSGSNSGSSDSGSGVATMAEFLYGGPYSDGSDDENDWEPAASP